jgi:hypothetical protein
MGLKGLGAKTNWLAIYRQSKGTLTLNLSVEGRSESSQSHQRVKYGLESRGTWNKNDYAGEDRQQFSLGAEELEMSQFRSW